MLFLNICSFFSIYDIIIFGCDDMKKTIKLLFLIILSIFLFSCDNMKNNNTSTVIENKDEYTITYICDNSISYTQETINKQINNLKPIENEYQKFLYWCSDKELKNKFDFNKKASSDIILYAKYEIDYMKLTNDLSNKYMTYNVKIECTYKQSGFMSSTYHTVGSGVIIDEDTTYYYALTNNHVTSIPDGYSNASYIVQDCYENEYEANIVYNLNTYDLALLRFKKNQEKALGVVAFASSSPKKLEPVISLGSPLGQANYITYGNYTNSLPFSPNDDTKDVSYVEFEVLIHNCEIKNGSSGGGLYNTNLELIGINFASASPIWRDYE